jgi:hypothetical protein
MLVHRNVSSRVLGLFTTQDQRMVPNSGDEMGKKLKLSLCTPRRRTGGVYVYLHSLLIAVLIGSEASLLPGKEPTVPTVQDALWAPEPV